MKPVYKIYLFIFILFFLVALFESLNAFDDGITGLTKKNGITEGCSCHNLTPFPNVSVLIISPSVVRPNDTVNCFLKISGGPHIAGGCDIAVGTGNLILSPLDTSLQRLLTTPGNYELTHRYPKLPSGDTITFAFKYIAPNSIGVDTIFANGNSVNHDTTSEGDQWNYAVNKLITISNSIGISGNSQVVKGFSLEQNYPNPFNPTTNIKYNIPENSFVSLKVYDILGREVATLINKFQPAGTYTVPFSISLFSNNQITSGVYFYKLTAEDATNKSNNFSEVKRMVVIK
jgi:hypothetical protein